MDVRNIIVAVDYSTDSQQALSWGMSLVEKYGSRLLLFYVIPKAVEEVFPQGTSVTSPRAYHLERIAAGIRPFAGQPIIIDLAEEVTRHAPCPVFTVRRQGEAAA